MLKKILKVAGIIVECNPLHNGHIAHIQETRRITGCEKMIAVMSGNFVQRGEPAVCDKWRRTKMALLAGVDMVIELPLPYVIGGADYFARGAVGLLAAAGIVDCLCFGSEAGDIDALKAGGAVLSEEPPIYKEALREALDAGRSFAAARGAALTAAMASATRALTTLPNNGLAMEYCKALALLGWPMEAYTTHRRAGGPSATAIRKGIHTNGGVVNSAQGEEMPDFACRILREARGEMARLDDFSPMFRYLIARNDAPVLNEGLHHRFRRFAREHTCLTDILAAVKTKRYTLTRLQREAMKLILGISPSDMCEYEAAGGPGYIRVLGFRRESAALLGQLTRRARLPVLTHGEAVRAFLSQGGAAAKMLEKEWESEDIYPLAYKVGCKPTAHDIYSKKRHNIIIIGGSKDGL